MRGSILHVPCLVMCIMALSSNALAGNGVSRPAGYIRIDLAPREQRLMSLPFEPFAKSIHSPDSISVLRWDSSAAAYFPLEEHASPKEVEGAVDGPPVLLPSMGFGLCNNDADPQTVFLTGLVVLDDTRTVELRSSLSLIGYPYSSAIPFNETALGRLFFAGTLTGDRISYSAKHGMTLEALVPAAPAAGVVDDVESLPVEDGHVRPGRGYWYEHNSSATLTIREPRPYGNPFPGKESLPRITQLEPSRNGMMLTLKLPRGTERYDIFYKDLSESEALITESGWILLVSSRQVPPLSEMNEDADFLKIVWTDNRDSVSGRLYLVARADIDLNANAIPDAREQFTMATPERVVGTTVKSQYNVAPWR